MARDRGKASVPRFRRWTPEPALSGRDENPHNVPGGDVPRTVGFKELHVLFCGHIFPRATRCARFGLLGVALVVLGACSSAPARFGGNSARADEWGVFEAVARWMHSAYDPSDANGPPAAFCLATGRRAATAIDGYRRGRNEPWVPAARLLDLLGDLNPPFVPIGECVRHDDHQERLGVDGPPAVVIILEQIFWETSSLAQLRVRTRENNSYLYSYGCRLERRTVDWHITDCI